MAPMPIAAKAKTVNFFYGKTRRRRRFKSSDAISYAIVRCPSRLPSFSSVWGRSIVHGLSSSSEPNQLNLNLHNEAQEISVTVSNKKQDENNSNLEMVDLVEEYGNYNAAGHGQLNGGMTPQRLKAVRHAEMQDFLHCTYASLDGEEELYKCLVELLIKDMAEQHRQQSDIFIPFPFGNSDGELVERQGGDPGHKRANEQLQTHAEYNESSMISTPTATQEPFRSPGPDQFDVDIDWDGAGTESGRTRALEPPGPVLEAHGTATPPALKHGPAEAEATCSCVWLPERHLSDQCVGASTTLELYKLLLE